LSSSVRLAFIQLHFFWLAAGGFSALLREESACGQASRAKIKELSAALLLHRYEMMSWQTEHH